MSNKFSNKKILKEALPKFEGKAVWLVVPTQKIVPIIDIGTPITNQ